MKDKSGGPDRRALIAGAPGLALAAAAGGASAEALPTPGVEFAFEAVVAIGPSQTPGATPYGRRNFIPILGGTFEGPRIRGKVLAGGGDWQLTRADGCLMLEADYFIQADDGTLIHVLNKAVISGLGGDPAAVYARSSPVFEAPIGPHDWLNKAIFVGTVTPVQGAVQPAVRIRVFKVT